MQTPQDQNPVLTFEGKRYEIEWQPGTPPPVVGSAGDLQAALVVDLPTILLVTLTALGGAGGIVFGLLLLTGSLDSDELSTTKTTDVIDLDWWWFAIYAALVISGVIAQARTAARLDETWRESWQRGLSTPDT